MKRWITVILIVLMVMVLCACAKADKLTQVVSANLTALTREKTPAAGSPSPAALETEKLTQAAASLLTYPEAVKLLGEPDQEDLYGNETDIVYNKYAFYGLSGRLAIGFVHVASEPHRVNDIMNYFEYHARGDTTELKAAADKITADYDELFGPHKSIGNDGIFWKNELRIEIGLYVDDTELALGWGNF